MKITTLPRLFLELQSYHDLPAAGAATVINRSRYGAAERDGHAAALSYFMIRVAFQRRRPWRERVATRYPGLMRAVAAQHSAPTFARLVSINQSGG